MTIPAAKPVLYTVGHSTRSLDEFMTLLLSAGLRQVVDVRTIPRSRRNPQFNGTTLAIALQNQGLVYRHLQGLGGLRHARPDSVNLGWRNPSFRGFADYMQTRDFAEALEVLLALAVEAPTVIMCAEALPWRCHRFLIADALVVRAFPVEHLMSPGVSRAHSLHPLAVVDNRLVRYPNPSRDGPPAGGAEGSSLRNTGNENSPCSGTGFPALSTPGAGAPAAPYPAELSQRE
ncbi:MAG: DUF488 domain-containing protein [Dehalococcoidales bacterium]|nr:DUF488 domain-containing protein [Dehalococcoidales bacterium]